MSCISDSDPDLTTVDNPEFHGEAKRSSESSLKKVAELGCR